MAFTPNRLIPRFDGVILSLEWKEALWDKFVTGALRPRMLSELQYSNPLADSRLPANDERRKRATVRTHLADFMDAYNFARRLKALNGLTAYEYICKIWTSEPHRFILNPIHQMPGLST